MKNATPGAPTSCQDWHNVRHATRLEQLKDQLPERVVLGVARLGEDVAAADVDDAAGGHHGGVQFRVRRVRRLLRLPGRAVRPEPAPAIAAGSGLSCSCKVRE